MPKIVRTTAQKTAFVIEDEEGFIYGLVYDAFAHKALERYLEKSKEIRKYTPKSLRARLVVVNKGGVVIF